MNHSHLRYRFYVATAAVSVAVGIVIGILLPIQSPVEIVVDTHENNSSYHFINPLLSCGDEKFSRIQNGQMNELQKKLDAYIASQTQEGVLDTASVYVRELNGGQFISINPDIQFIPASLLKVPLAMSIYLHGERDPDFLAGKVFVGAVDTPASEFFTAPIISASTTYSVQQLLDTMIMNSDNAAALALVGTISTADLDQSYSDLGVIVPSDEKYTMTVASYAGFFRVLYNATYLTHADSEHLLDLLSRSVFKQGLVAGLPPGVVVSHKFGERGFNNPQTPDQLHDCGIVYTRNPYVICVMTQGRGYEAMAGVIANISKMVYAYAGL